MMDIAIVGRPNVGKSALFNRIAGRRIAIVHGQPGITRDRISARCEIRGQPFRLWDTGGIAGAGETQLTADVQTEAARAMTESDLILFVVDGQDGLNPMDRELARMIRKLRKPVLLLVNKIDDPKHQARADEFSALGFEEVLPISAAHGRGMPELLEKIGKFFPGNAQRSTTNGAGVRKKGVEHPIALAVIGRPNAGKSSLINALLRDRRTIVSKIPGTTRDAVDVEYERDGKRYLFIDTAGIRHRSKHSSSVEVFSVMRAERTIARADICILVVDAAEGIRAQDRRVAASIQKARKACLIALNKWDLVRQAVIPSAVERSRGSYLKAATARSLGPSRTDVFARDDRLRERKAMEQAIANARAELFFIDYAPVLVTSALTGEHAERIFRKIERIRRAAGRHIGTGKLNRVLRAAVAANPPPMVKGNRLKLFYATQSGGDESRALAPPEFVLFVNSPRLLAQPYARFLEAKIREVEPYPGLPVLLKVRARSES
jgi:GTP-binding protein